MSASLLAAWRETVGRRPGATAVVEAASGRAWTRRELERAASEWAVSFPRRGGGVRRPRVILSVPNGAGWFHAFLGLLMAGSVPVPADPGEPVEALLQLARAVGAPLVWRDGAAIAVAGSRRPRARPGECLLKLTSGTSGLPRGLPATAAQMLADGRQVCRSMGIGPRDLNLAAIPLGYSYGLGNLVLPLLAQGTPLVCASGVLPHALAADARVHRPTVFPAVPPLLRALAESDVDPRDLASLRLVISAGSRIAPEVCAAFEQRFGIRVHGFYGTSETGGISFDRSGEATRAGRSVGTALDGVSIAVRGGRLSVASAAVLGRGRFRPADRASLNPRNELVLEGRIDRVAKVAGRRVDLAEVEAALRSLAGVRDARAEAVGAEGVLAAAVATALPASEVRQRLRRLVAPWKVPARIVVLGSFPVNARGKPDPGRLRQILLAPRTVSSTSTLSSDRQMSART